MISKLSIYRYFGILFIVLFVGCESSALKETPIATRTSAPALTAAITPVPSLVLASVTPTVISTATPSLPVSSAPEGLRMAYILDGNLYFQDGGNPAKQLTRSGEDWLPIFSNGGEKIVYMRGKEIHSIRINDGQEQVLVTSRLLRAIDASYTESTEFHRLTIVPDTHLLLFATHESSTGNWNNDLFIVDINTAEIKRILPLGEVGNFYVSPDGKFIAIDAVGQIDIIDLGGKIVRQNLLTYTPSEPSFLPPGIYWMQDSTGLIVVLPVPTSYEGNEPPDYTVWRYAVDGSPGEQVTLAPLPSDHQMAKVSPDGNWLIYNDYEGNAFYIGNLRTSHTELYESQSYVYHYDRSWSPDSTHFIYMTARKLYLGSPIGSFVLIGRGGFLGWADSSHYLYYADEAIVWGEIGGEEKVIFTGAHEFFQDTTVFTFMLLTARER